MEKSEARDHKTSLVKYMKMKYSWMILQKDQPLNFLIRNYFFIVKIHHFVPCLWRSWRVMKGSIIYEKFFFWEEIFNLNFLFSLKAFDYTSTHKLKAKLINLPFFVTLQLWKFNINYKAHFLLLMECFMLIVSLSFSKVE